MTTNRFLRTPRAAAFGALAVAGLGYALSRRSPSTQASAASEPPESVTADVPAEPAVPQNMSKAALAAAPRVFSSGLSMVSLRLKSSEDVTHNVKRLRFEFPTPDAVSGLSPVSSVLTLSWPQGSLFPVPRPYTPISRLDEPGHLDLLVKRYPDGRASTYLHSLQPGQSLRFIAALGGYRWTPNKHPHVVLIAGGAGLTPIYQLVQTILHNRDDKTRATLVFGVHSDRDVLLRSELDALEDKFRDRFRVVYAVSHPDPGSPFRRGRVTKELLAEVLGEEGDEAARRNTKVMVCGPPAMESALVGSSGRFGSRPGILQELGYGKDQIHTF